MIRNFSLFSLALLLFTACEQSTDSNLIVSQTDSISINKSPYDFSEINSRDLPHIKLILSRGAFHYDSFELNGNILKFIPIETGYTEDQVDYQQEFEVILEDSIVLKLINDLIENSIFEMDSLYESQTTCNSILEVELFIYDAHIKIICADFERECPEIISKLEERLIELSGKDLKRFILPG